MTKSQLKAKLKKVVMWVKVIIKFTAVGTIISSAVTAITSSAAAGFAASAGGVTGYAAVKTIPVTGYEKTKHISPRTAYSSPRIAQMPAGVLTSARPMNVLPRKLG